ncbi:hypothetical protein SAMN04487898_11469 [Pedobacter sp. ok626]|uniref:hypothetical protein n=1 Tax=Pedobacter sp. ok626 TaxID=1761882 RepID=UPI00088ABCEC|nr:hypothetical protein [Pedobacter sp. ok626]SDL03261.1 hypothetical protein SAMN04487898_11469 [Pedobacter sp. ok626]
MDKKLLNRYFEKQCSATEIKAVEEWILDSKNRIEFDDFLVTKWDGHVDQNFDPHFADVKKSATYKWWASAAATAAVIICGVYYANIVSSKTDQLAVVSTTSAVKPVDHHASFPSDTFHASIKPKITTHHERKTIRNKPVQIVTEADTVTREKRPLFVKSTKLGNFMINKVAIHKLLDSIGSDQLVLTNFDVHEITFQRLAIMLREECGIVLEPCSGGIGSTKTYTARFQRISVPDLLNDMSEKMMFSYSVKDNKVKICFN